MKKLFIAASAILLSLSAFSQKSGTEVGIRLFGGDLAGVGADASFPMSRTNRLHCDAGVIGGGISGNVLYDWLFPIPELPELVFYPGVGGGTWIGDDAFNLAIVGEAGLEYRFDFPLTIGIDARPRINFIEGNTFAGEGALIARYRF